MNKYLVAFWDRDVKNLRTEIVKWESLSEENITKFELDKLKEFESFYHVVSVTKLDW